MKVGTLVMKIAIGNPKNTALTIPTGQIGEVRKAPYGMKVFDTHVVVYFPNYPSPLINQTWQLDFRLVVPISDPDADVTETEEETFEDFV